MAEILLLEDEPILGDQLKDILELDGHSVAFFVSVAPAVEHFESNPVDLVIADIFIKNDGEFEAKGGMTLITKIRQTLGSSVPIIAISGSFVSDTNESLSRARITSTSKTLGANETLAKPFEPGDLLLLVSRVLRRADRL